MDKRTVPNPKTARVTATVTPEEADYIKRCAEASQLSVSEFIREVLVGTPA